MIPTPTALPPMTGAPMINVIDAADWRIWNFAPTAVQWWNRLETAVPGVDARLVIQWAVIVVIVIGFVVLLTALVKSFQDDTSEVQK